MSWLNQHSHLRDQDLELLDFEPHPNEVFVISLPNRPYKSNLDCSSDVEHVATPQTSRKVIAGESDLQQWLTRLSGYPPEHGVSTDGTNDDSSTINLILAPQMSSLDELPFTKKAYRDIMSQMKMHGSIVRAINRNTHCAFSTLPYIWPCGDLTVPSIIYNLRTAGSWEGDMALSVTFFPNTLTTNAVWYGLDMNEHRTYGHNLTNADIITSRLTNFDGKCLHPLILPTVFAEFERERHVALVRKYSTQLVQRIHDLAYPSLHQSKETETISSKVSSQRLSRDHDLTKRLKAWLSNFRKGCESERSAAQEHPPSVSETGHRSRYVEKKEEPEPAVVLWQNTSFLSNGLQNWQTQLRKMVQQVQELDDTNFGIDKIDHNPEVESKLSRLREVGSRIETKVQDLIDEYDEHIRQCNHITEGLRLATQLELNEIGHEDARINQEIARVNLKVARMTRIDSSLMRSIATLGMIFLPATFVSSFFSMDFFQWAEEDGKSHELVSSYFWVYIVVAVGLTVLTMSIFYTCVLRAPVVEVDEESRYG
ncbi:hypothetical protein FGRMN_1303 [Fusarium graminum]|nr:hypothetical protein FGRMN_1303 [Fusarium graminum]